VRILNELAQLIDTAPEPEGTLSVVASATIETYLLPTQARRFSEKHPEADLDLRLRNTGELIAEMLYFGADRSLIECQCTEARLASEI